MAAQAAEVATRRPCDEDGLVDPKLRVRDPGLHLEPKSKLRHTWNLKLEFKLRDPRPGTWTPNLGLRDPRPSFT